MKKYLKSIRTSLILWLVIGITAGCAVTTPVLPTETQAPSEVPAKVETAAPTEQPTVEPTPTEVEFEQPLAINLTWHQHQPMYSKDADGVYTRPWVRVHATKDYLDMVENIAMVPGFVATINLTPTLMEQINDFANGAKDKYWVLAEKNAAELTEADKTFILQRFFDVNLDHIISRFPRFRELYDLRAGSDERAINNALKKYTEQDFRDLQIWFNLAWVDPDYLAAEPFKPLVDKGRDFTEEDKPILFDGILELIKKVIPMHRQLQEMGLIEVTTTPYAHPILPLITNTDLALIGNSKATMPAEVFAYPQDAEAQLAKSVEMYETEFGKGVSGLWPGEGAVASEVIDMISNAGYKYIQTGEPVLVKSLGLSGDAFPRDSQGLVQDADALYRPYFVNGPDGGQLAVFFRDWRMSDLIGFTYAGMSGEEAAQDLVNRLLEIQKKFVDEGNNEPHIITIVVDGENAWENYENDGKEFLNTFYRMVTNTPKLMTVTPSEYLQLFPEQRSLPTLFQGAWFSPNYDTWIGETEEAQGWDLLLKVRKDLEEFSADSSIDPAKLVEATNFMYRAEGSDWFWWYGTDQDSGQDSYFDEGFRAMLRSVYTSVDREPPSFLDVPIVKPAALKANQEASAFATPVVDGTPDDEAWASGAYYRIRENDTLYDYAYVFDADNLYLKWTLDTPATAADTIDLYLEVLARGSNTVRSAIEGTTLPSPANRLLRINFGTKSVGIFNYVDDSWQPGEVLSGSNVAGNEDTAEVQIPLATLGEISSGNVIRMVTYFSATQAYWPETTASELRYNEFRPLEEIFNIQDPAGDDSGPGSYVYPKDGVFNPGAFDLRSVQVASDGPNLVFSFVMEGEINNGWNSPNGFSVQTFDIYIDKDPGNKTGERLLLPGRNAALAVENGWELAVWVEGWNSQVVTPDPANPGQPIADSSSTAAIKLYVDAGRKAIIASVPKEYFGEGDPASWGYAIAVMSQEGYPAEGVWRIRDVSAVADQYKFGGAPSDTNHTRMIDLALPEDFTPGQNEALSTYPTSNKAATSLTADDFAIIPLVTVK
ncbi:MAG: glucodextranase DOMON-like domain-containing protein [Anaerolineaceae bacterium]